MPLYTNSQKAIHILINLSNNTPIGKYKLVKPSAEQTDTTTMLTEALLSNQNINSFVQHQLDAWIFNDANQALYDKYNTLQLLYTCAQTIASCQVNIPQMNMLNAYMLLLWFLTDQLLEHISTDRFPTTKSGLTTRTSILELRTKKPHIDQLSSICNDCIQLVDCLKNATLSSSVLMSLTQEMIFAVSLLYCHIRSAVVLDSIPQYMVNVVEPISAQINQNILANISPAPNIRFWAHFRTDDRSANCNYQYDLSISSFILKSIILYCASNFIFYMNCSGSTPIIMSDALRHAICVCVIISSVNTNNEHVTSKILNIISGLSDADQQTVQMIGRNHNNSIFDLCNNIKLKVRGFMDHYNTSRLPPLLFSFILSELALNNKQPKLQTEYTISHIVYFANKIYGTLFIGKIHTIIAILADMQIIFKNLPQLINGTSHLTDYQFIKQITHEPISQDDAIQENIT